MALCVWENILSYHEPYSSTAASQHEIVYFHRFNINNLQKFQVDFLISKKKDENFLPELLQS